MEINYKEADRREWLDQVHFQACNIVLKENDFVVSNFKEPLIIGANILKGFDSFW